MIRNYYNAKLGKSVYPEALFWHNSAKGLFTSLGNDDLRVCRAYGYV